jgi:hypothetical protein
MMPFRESTTALLHPRFHPPAACRVHLSPKDGSKPGNLAQVTERLRSATELLGEKEERMAELAADVADMRQLYREQVEVFVDQLARVSQQTTPQLSPRPQQTDAEGAEISE